MPAAPRLCRRWCCLSLAVLAGCLTAGSLSLPDLADSLMVATPANVPADGNHAAAITAQLRRPDGGPLADLPVAFAAVGCAVTQASDRTDARGRIDGEVRCTAAGQTLVTATATIADKTVALPTSTTVLFFAPANPQGAVDPGQPLNVQAWAASPAGLIDTGLLGEVVVESSDPAALLPPGHVLAAGERGTYLWPSAALLSTPGPQTLTVRHVASGRQLRQDTVVVAASAASRLVLELASTEVVAGAAVALTVSARTAAGARIADFAGEVRLSCSDPQATLPPPYQFVAADGGEHILQVQLTTLGSQRITVADGAGRLLPGELAGISVQPGPAARLRLDLPTDAEVGEPLDLQVTPLDALGNPTPSLLDVLHFDASDRGATLPPDDAPGGPRTYYGGVVLRAPGTQEVVVTNLSQPGFPPAQAAVEVAAVPATHLAVAGPPSAIAGVAQQVSITALGDGGRVAAGYTGTVALSSADPLASAAGSFTFDASASGQATLPAAFTWRRSGPQTLHAVDLARPDIAGDASAVPVAGNSAVQLALSLPAQIVSEQPVDLVVIAADAFGNPAPGFVGTIALAADVASAVLPASVMLGAADAGRRVLPGALSIAAAGTAHITASDGAGVLPAAVAAVDVVPGPAASLTAQRFGDSFGHAFLGTSYGVTLRAYDHAGNLAINHLGTVRFAAGGAAATAPASATFGASDAGSIDVTVALARGQATHLVAVDPSQPQRYAFCELFTSKQPADGYANDFFSGGITNSPVPGGSSCSSPTIAQAADGTPTVAWVDSRNGWQIYALRWNGVDTWLPLGSSASGPGVSGGLAQISGAVSLAIDPGTDQPVAAWAYGDLFGTGKGSIYLRAWDNGAGSWVERAGSGSGDGIDNTHNDCIDCPQLAFRGGQPLVVWQAQAGGVGNIAVRALQFDGSAWVAPDGAGEVSVGMAGDHEAPSLAVSGSGVAVVAWKSNGPGRGQIYLRQLVAGSWVGIASSDLGDGISQTAGEAYDPHLALASGGAPWVLWLDATYVLDGSGGTPSHLLVRTTDGSSWSGPGGAGVPPGIDDDPAGAIFPAIAVDGSDRVTVAWVVGRYGVDGPGSRIRMRQYNGSAWLPLDDSASFMGTGLGAVGSAQGDLVPRLLPRPDGSLTITYLCDKFGGNRNVAVCSWP